MMLTELLYKHFKMINSRHNTFSGIIKSLILCRGSYYKNLAEEIKGDILLDSKIKAVSRFLKGNHIDDNEFCNFMRHFIPEGKLLLSIDRTTWELGKNIRNILVLAVSYEKIGMPILFKEIGYRGACTAEDQIEIIREFVRVYGKERIEAVMGDREFDNEKLINYLHAEGINYALRLRKTNRIVDKKGERIRIERLGKQQLRNLKTRLYQVPVKFDHIKLLTGEYLSVASSIGSRDAFELYRRRWDIEAGFKGCKTSGFKMEESNLIDADRFVNFIKCIFIAFAVAIKTGELANNKSPIKTKKTLQCKAYSILQWGIRAIKTAYSIGYKTFYTLLNQVFLYAKLC